MSHITRNKEAYRSRQIEAQQRQEARNKRSDREQIQRLEFRGHGNCKEAKRLRERIAREEMAKKGA